MRIIRSPKYWVNGIQCNEYTVRAAQLDVAKGLISDITVVDEAGNERTIDKNGRLSGPLKGYDLATNLMLQMLDPDEPDLTQEYSYELD